jgi:ParB-like chromosome segregation protein Spo0J
MSDIPDTLDALRVPLGSLTPYERNPRRGSIELLKDSLTRHGQYRPIVVNARTREVLAGNHTLHAAAELGWQDIAATFVDVDADTAARIVLIDNRANDQAGYDDVILAGLLQELPSLDGTGYGDDDLAQLIARLSDDDDFDTGPALGEIEYRLLIECSDEQHQGELLARFQAEGLDVRALAQ